jgi:hypothetical protein
MCCQQKHYDYLFCKCNFLLFCLTVKIYVLSLRFNLKRRGSETQNFVQLIDCTDIHCLCSHLALHGIISQNTILMSHYLHWDFVKLHKHIALRLYLCCHNIFIPCVLLCYLDYVRYEDILIQNRFGNAYELKLFCFRQEHMDDFNNLVCMDF